MGTRYAAVGALLLAAGFTVYAIFYAATTAPAPQVGGPMGQGLVPSVRGLYRGKEVTFIHTEASDPQVAQMLTQMMGPRVLTVPSLARVPQALLADVYVFTNGIKGAGPFGFQVDVFDSIPGQPRYTPLRAVVLVTWKTGTTARLLGSVEEIQAAVGKGDVTLKRPGVVVNMPILSWPGGRR
jgi:hypothetical protein